MSQQLQVPCLGRPFSLGMLYDCRTERLIPGKTLWDAQTLKSASKLNKTPSSSDQVIPEDTIQDKSQSLNIRGDLKLSVLCGLVEVSGAAKYFRDERTSAKQSRVTLHYSTTSHFEQLTMDQLNNVEFPPDKDATHVVTGITYGADAFFVFDRTVSEDEKMNKVHEKMQAAIQAIPKLSTSVAGQAVENADKNETDKFQCKFYGDLILPSNPSTFDEVVELYKDLPKPLKDESTLGPKLAYLMPLPLQQPDQVQPQPKISTNIISEVEEAMKHFNHTEMRVNDLLKHEMCFKFSNIGTQISRFKTLFLKFKTNFTSKLSENLLKIRRGEADEKKLEELVSSLHDSPFSQTDVRRFLDAKEVEINQLTQLLRNMEEEPNIQFDFPNSSYKLSTLKFDVNLDRIVCFGFNVTSETSPYLQTLERHLKNKKPSSSSDTEWFKKVHVTQELRKKTLKFINSAQQNSAATKTRYIATNMDEETTPGHPSLTLYISGVQTPFDPPGKPGTPTTKATKNGVQLEWSAPREGTVVSYKVVCCASDGSMSQSNETKSTKYTLTGLNRRVEYECHILAIGEHGLTARSDVCQIATQSAGMSLAQDFLKLSKPITSPTKPPIPIFQLPLKLVAEDSENQLRKFEIYLPSTPLESYQKPEKVLMVVGATGAGKTTLLDAMANYVLGVTWEDEFRFKIISEEGICSQAHSQTKHISAYSFRSTNLPFNLTVIDTPGFGDTGGIENDRSIIAKQIKNFFSRQGGSCSIDQLHGIGFVTPASQARLTTEQKYVFNIVLSIFGKDIEQNIFLMTTFADGKIQPVLEAVKEAKVPYKKDFKFNNSALYASNDSQIDSFFWGMCYTSFKDFLQYFSQVEVQSLTLTRAVLREREQLETLIPQLKEQVCIGMIKMDEINQEEAILKQHEAELNTSKDFEYTIEVTKFRKVDLEPGIHTTTCKNCNHTCHSNCKIPLDKDKARCCMMKNDKCVACPGKCHWSDHSNVPYVFEYYTVEETRTSHDLKRKYDSAKCKKKDAEAMIAENEDQLAQLHAEVHLLITQTHESIEKLQRIALKPNPLTEIEYLDLLIQSEQQEVKPGWQKRVEKYQDFRKDAEIYKKVVEQGIEALDDIIKLDDRPGVKKRIQELWKRTGDRRKKRKATN